MARSRDISKVLSSNTTLATDDEVAATYQTKASNGMTLISNNSFSSVGTYSLPINTFTSTYDNYRLIVKISAITSDAILYMKMRKSGTDASTLYYYGMLGYSSNPSTENKNGSNVSTGVYLHDLDTGSSAKPTWSTVDLFIPFVTGFTMMNIQSVANTQSGTPVAAVGMGYHSNSDSYDSASFIASAGNISGSITVYGYNK
jgi:hypothetical protein